MKRTISLIICAVVIFSAAACGSGKKDQASAPAATEPEVIELRIPESLFEYDMNDMDTYVRDNGFISAAVNKDKSVSVVMTKEKHQEILNAKRQITAEKLNSMVEGKDTPYVKRVEFSDNFDRITIYADKSGYKSAFLNMTTSIAGITGMIYQVYEPTINRVEVKVLDEKTNEEIETVIYPDELDN